MANISEKAISILAGNLNLGHSYLITTVQDEKFMFAFCFMITEKGHILIFFLSNCLNTLHTEGANVFKKPVFRINASLSNENY